jgi:hypothetical protein
MRLSCRVSSRENHERFCILYFDLSIKRLSSSTASRGLVTYSDNEKSYMHCVTLYNCFKANSKVDTSKIWSVALVYTVYALNRRTERNYRYIVVCAGGCRERSSLYIIAAKESRESFQTSPDLGFTDIYLSVIAGPNGVMSTASSPSLLRRLAAGSTMSTTALNSYSIAAPIAQRNPSSLLVNISRSVVPERNIAPQTLLLLTPPILDMTPKTTREIAKKSKKKGPVHVHSCEVCHKTFERAYNRDTHTRKREFYILSYAMPSCNRHTDFADTSMPTIFVAQNLKTLTTHLTHAL